MRYLAEWECGNTFISTDSDMDTYLSHGARIYALESVTSEERTLIATPEDGYLTEKPILDGRAKRE